MAEFTELEGWGRTPRSYAEVHTAEQPGLVVPRSTTRGHLARGLGRSYGDAALNSGGVVWDTTSLSGIDVDPGTGIATVGAGVSYRQLLDRVVPLGWFPPVTPGTKYVTLGGAIAADVHGKNHHRDGSIRHHLISIAIRTADGEDLEVGPGDDLFEATVGGMGLTGIVMSATIKLSAITSPLMLVETVRTADLEATLAALKTADESHRYTVAWVDLQARGARAGRGVLTAGDHDASRPTDSGWQAPSPVASMPVTAPNGLVNRFSVSLLNELWHRKAPRHRIAPESIESFFYPLDVLGGWNRMYGERGFVQYQFVVPDAEIDQLRRIIEVLRSSGAPLALAVLKRFGEGAGLLSFPSSGWTLAVDIPASGSLAPTLDTVDGMVAGAGGRVYLAKDGRMRRELLSVMYPELNTWRSIADKYDPERRFRSDLDRRLGIREG